MIQRHQKLDINILRVGKQRRYRPFEENTEEGLTNFAGEGIKILANPLRPRNLKRGTPSKSNIVLSNITMYATRLINAIYLF